MREPMFERRTVAPAKPQPPRRPPTYRTLSHVEQVATGMLFEMVRNVQGDKR